MASGWFMRDLGGVEALLEYCYPNAVGYASLFVIVIFFLATAVANHARHTEAEGLQRSNSVLSSEGVTDSV